MRIEYIRQCIWTRVCEEHQKREYQHRSAVLGDRIGISMKLRRRHPRSGNNTSNGKQTKKSASEGFQWHQSSNKHVNGSAQQSISIEQMFSLLKDRVLSKQLFTNALVALLLNQLTGKCLNLCLSFRVGIELRRFSERRVCRRDTRGRQRERKVPRDHCWMGE